MINRQKNLKNTFLIFLILSLLITTSCQNKVEQLEAEIKPVITIGRQTVVQSKLPEGDTYEDNAYTRLIESELNIDLVSAFEVLQADYSRQVSMGIVTKDIPDIMQVDSLDQVYELYENGLIADLTDVYNEYATEGIKAKYDSYDGKCLADVTIDNKMLALPNTNLLESPTIVWVRSDWIKEIGLEIDLDNDRKITLNELELIAKSFVEANIKEVETPVGIVATSDVIGLNSDYSFCLNQIAYAMGAMPKTWYLDENDELIYGSITKETLDFLILMNQWFEDGVLDPQFATRTWDDIQNLLINGSTGIALGAWHMPDWGLNTVYANDVKATFDAYALQNEDRQVFNKYNRASDSYIVVSNECEYPEIAIQILNLLNDDDLIDQSALNYPEIELYQKLAVDGSTRPFNIVVVSATSLLDDYNDIELGLSGEIPYDEVKTLESKATITSIQSYLKQPTNARNAEWAKYHSRIKGISLYKLLKENDDYKWLTPIIPKTTQTMEINSVQLANLENEFFIKVILGLIDPYEGYEEFVETWNELGGLEITNEILFS